jgi:hypothetical protein
VAAVTIDFSILMQFFGAALGGISVYVAIRSDLADLKARMILVEKSADAAHSRVDQLLTK